VDNEWVDIALVRRRSAAADAAPAALRRADGDEPRQAPPESGKSAVLLIIAIMAGGLVNIPVRRIRHARDVETNPLAAHGMAWPQLRRVRQETVVAVNLG